MLNINFTSCKNCGSVLDLDVITSKVNVEDYFRESPYGGDEMITESTYYDKYDTQEFHPLHPCPCCGEKIVVKNLTL